MVLKYVVVIAGEVQAVLGAECLLTLAGIDAFEMAVFLQAAVS